MSRPTIGLWAGCCLCLIAFGLPDAQAQDQAEDESLLKAAFIYNFAKFTRWPASAWNGQQAPLTLCTVGKGELAGSLKRLGGETVEGRRVAIRAVEAGHVGEDCHVLFIAGSAHGHYAGLIEETRNAPVLTISEIRGFADSGGIIQLYRAEDRIRFKINLGVARDRGLKLSVRLLDLAEIVDSGVAP